MSGEITSAIIYLGKKGNKITVNKRKKESDEAFKKHCEKYLKANGAKGAAQLNVSRKGIARNEIVYLRR